MAAVAAEPAAAAVPSTTISAETDDEGSAEPGPLGPGVPGALLETGPAVETVVRRGEGGGEERRHVRPESAAGNALSDGPGSDDRPGTGPVDRFSPGVPIDSEGVYRSTLADPQPAAVFLHSVPDPPPLTEAGLSLAEPAEPDRAETADRDRSYRVQPELRLTVPATEELPGLRDSSPRSRLMAERPTGEEPASEQDLSPGSEVRVSLDHVIDDALVVSFRVGQQLFSGVLMDVSRRFGPYGIPITVFPRRDDQSRPVQSPPAAVVVPLGQQEGVAVAPPPWTSKPPPLFQDGAPYPPPLFIRDTYNQALPQPLPRKIKRPKRRYRSEEPTSIMNAIKLRPRQVLCDKCKGAVASGGHRESRRGPGDPRGDEASRPRRRPAEGPLSSEVKRLRSDDKRGRSAADRRSSSSGIRVSSSSSSQRTLRGVASSSSSPSSSSMCLKLNPKKVLSKGSTVDCSETPQVLKKLARTQRPKDQNQDQNQDQDQDQNRSKAVTRAAALQNHNQKVHFTRRLQHLGGAAAGSLVALPPRMRLKPQRIAPRPVTRPVAGHAPEPIYGFPWWPARVLGITVSRRGDTGLAVRQEARVSWFGSPTTSFLPLAQLAPFLESFQSRFDRKRKGPYRRAIAEAASAAKQLTPEVRALLTQFET
ncbi:PWWP domain-containing protein 2A [Liparis tanakae]|uniref:PWWP domain-containing protein 2A n=1 Tax=Liparis tanakae TaxID=230148 RepID=A0A4Z2EL86_9TELE|nr:PWWP domain-containing protein 2A [Liparis tanakae]